jgi:hypothetical protein
MRPRRLELLNVGPFVGRTEIDFDSLGDIFLISGKTGSGKTTVFDSICYALYGNLPGGRRNQARRLRSDFAPEEADCSVALDFDLGDRTYRVEREPPRSRKKARGDGVVEDPETATIFERTAAGLVPLSGKKTDADERIRALMGLSFDEFSKIVLLPQGEFAEFLKQSTADRREVLRKLFPVDHAVRTRELATERSKAATARLAEAERALAEAVPAFRRRSTVRENGWPRSGWPLPRSGRNAWKRSGNVSPGNYGRPRPPRPSGIVWKRPAQPSRSWRDGRRRWSGPARSWPQAGPRDPSLPCSPGKRRPPWPPTGPPKPRPRRGKYRKPKRAHWQRPRNGAWKRKALSARLLN